MPRSSSVRSIAPILRQVVRQPTWLATALSVGIHGLFWGVLPILPSLPEELDDQRTVGVVELSPEEQARIPDFSTPNLELPPLSDSDLYSLSPLPSQSAPTQLFPPFPSYPTNPFPSYDLPSESTTTRRTEPSTNPTANPTTNPSAPQPQPGGLTPANPDVSQNPALDRLSRRFGTQPNSASNEGSAAGDTRTAEQRLQDAIAQRRTAIEQLGADPSGMTQEEARTTFVDWLETQVSEGADRNWKSLEIPAVYPQEACPLEIEPAAVYGVVLDRENKLVGDPKLVQSSGYRLFNQKALEAIASHEFSDEPDRETELDANRVYVVTVKFDYTNESCQIPAPTEPPPAG